MSRAQMSRSRDYAQAASEAAWPAIGRAGAIEHYEVGVETPVAIDGGVTQTLQAIPNVGPWVVEDLAIPASIAPHFRIESLVAARHPLLEVVPAELFSSASCRDCGEKHGRPRVNSHPPMPAGVILVLTVTNTRIPCGHDECERVPDMAADCARTERPRPGAAALRFLASLSLRVVGPPPVW